MSQQCLFARLSSDTSEVTANAQWAIEISSIVDDANFLSVYRRGFGFDPNILGGVYLHTSTAFSGQLSFEYHLYRRTSADHDDRITLVTASLNLVLLKTFVLGSGIYHFKSHEMIQRPPDPIVRGFYDGGGRSGAYWLAGLRAEVPIDEMVYAPIGYYFVIGSAQGGDGAWWYHGLRFGIGLKF